MVHFREVFDRISFLPDPMPQNDAHYKEFKDIFGTETTEDHSLHYRSDCTVRRACHFLLLLTK